MSLNRSAYDLKLNINGKTSNSIFLSFSLFCVALVGMKLYYLYEKYGLTEAVYEPLRYQSPYIVGLLLLAYLCQGLMFKEVQLRKNGIILTRGFSKQQIRYNDIARVQFTLLLGIRMIVILKNGQRCTLNLVPLNNSFMLIDELKRKTKALREDVASSVNHALVQYGSIRNTTGGMLRFSLFVLPIVGGVITYAYQFQKFKIDNLGSYFIGIYQNVAILIAVWWVIIPLMAGFWNKLNSTQHRFVAANFYNPIDYRRRVMGFSFAQFMLFVSYIILNLNLTTAKVLNENNILALEEAKKFIIFQTAMFDFKKNSIKINNGELVLLKHGENSNFMGKVVALPGQKVKMGSAFVQVKNGHFLIQSDKLPDKNYMIPQQQILGKYFAGI